MRAVDNKMTNTAQSVCEVSSENGSGNVITYPSLIHRKTLTFFYTSLQRKQIFFRRLLVKTCFHGSHFCLVSQLPRNEITEPEPPDLWFYHFLCYRGRYLQKIRHSKQIPSTVTALRHVDGPYIRQSVGGSHTTWRMCKYLA